MSAAMDTPEFWARQAEIANAQADAMRDAIERAAAQIEAGLGVDALSTLRAALDRDDDAQHVVRIQRPGVA